MTTGN